jgi:hypothetical protein
MPIQLFADDLDQVVLLMVGNVAILLAEECCTSPLVALEVLFVIGRHCVQQVGSRTVVVQRMQATPADYGLGRHASEQVARP